MIHSRNCAIAQSLGSETMTGEVACLTEPDSPLNSEALRNPEGKPLLFGQSSL